MNKMNKIIWIILLCYLLNNCWACSCIGKSTVEEEIKKSDVVFSGKIISKNFFIVEDSNLPLGFTLRKAEYIILVTKIYKGEIQKDTLKLISGVGNGDCGYEFEIGKEYIIYSVYADRYFDGGKLVVPFLYTDICTRTTRMNKKELKKIKRYLKHV